MCGEYGDIRARPHYHAILFGLHLSDLTPFSYSGSAAGPRAAQALVDPGQRAALPATLYTSETLTKTWGLGHVTIGHVTFQSASYVASYCTKKINISRKTPPELRDTYIKTDHSTGEIYERTPEYARMSLKPAIALPWIKKFTSDVYSYDHVVIDGRKQKPPRYYDKYLETINPALLEKFKLDRQVKGALSATENTPSRLKAREIYSTARFKQSKRTL